MGLMDSFSKNLIQGFLRSQVPEDIGTIDIDEFRKSDKFIKGTLHLRGEEKPVEFNFNYVINEAGGKYYLKITKFFANRIWINNAFRIYSKEIEVPKSAANIINILL